MIANFYIVITPYGSLQINFHDEGGNNIEGPVDATTYFEDVLSEITGPLGITLSLGTLEPFHLTDFLDRTERGLKIIAPLEYAAEISHQN